MNERLHLFQRIFLLGLKTVISFICFTSQLNFRQECRVGRPEFFLSRPRSSFSRLRRPGAVRAQPCRLAIKREYPSPQGLDLGSPHNLRCILSIICLGVLQESGPRLHRSVLVTCSLHFHFRPTMTAWKGFTCFCFQYKRIETKDYLYGYAIKFLHHQG